ncbi:MAG: lysophospholipid acyltransferase family protein [bacterium]|nr:lysophospholipid acyltransferase family protein [bacterium]
MRSLLKRARWRLEYAALCTLRGAVRRLSPTRRAAAARRLGDAVCRVWGYRREVVLAQLHQAFPDWDEARRRDVAGRVYGQIATSLFEFMVMDDLTPERIRELVDLDDPGVLAPLRASGRGFIFTTGHFGNFEMLGAALTAHGYPLHVVVRQQSNPHVDRLQNAIRARSGVQAIRADGSVRQLVKLLRGGGTAAMLPDVNAGRDGVFVEFLGAPASTPPGLAYFAWKLGCPIVPVFLVRQPDGRHVAHVTPVIEPDPTQDEASAVLALTQAHTDRLAEFVRRYPDHWFWVHRRWKTQPPRKDDS